MNIDPHTYEGLLYAVIGVCAVVFGLLGAVVMNTPAAEIPIYVGSVIGGVAIILGSCYIAMVGKTDCLR